MMFLCLRRSLWLEYPLMGFDAVVRCLPWHHPLGHVAQGNVTDSRMKGSEMPNDAEIPGDTSTIHINTHNIHIYPIYPIYPFPLTSVDLRLLDCWPFHGGQFGFVVTKRVSANVRFGPIPTFPAGRTWSQTGAKVPQCDPTIPLWFLIYGLRFLDRI